LCTGLIVLAAVLLLLEISKQWEGGNIPVSSPKEGAESWLQTAAGRRVIVEMLAKDPFGQHACMRRDLEDAREHNAKLVAQVKELEGELTKFAARNVELTEKFLRTEQMANEAGQLSHKYRNHIDKIRHAWNEGLIVKVGEAILEAVK
jgi:hypothetical protein